jgi:hypothetical protein
VFRGGLCTVCGANTNRLRHISVPQSGVVKQLVHPVTVQTLSDEIPSVTQSPCSPDVAPCDFWLFPRLKIGLRGNGLGP